MLTTMPTQEFEDCAVAIAEEFGWCYISARFIERIDRGEVRFVTGKEIGVGIHTCGLYSRITHELLASVSE